MPHQRYCTIDGCDDVHLARGYCHRHYDKWKRLGDPLAGRTYARHGAAEQWLETHLAAGQWPTIECIEWPYGKFRTGYAQTTIFRGDRSETVVSRIVCNEINGPSDNPEHIWVLHQPEICHNKACVNPNHLRWGSPQDNADDKQLDQTVPRGESHSNSKLTLGDIKNIRTDTRKHRVIAEHYGITKGSVWRIKHRRRWKHVP